MLGIGIDTGGTCTDAVIYDFETREILASGKAQTTKSNLEIGIAHALDTLPRELVEKAEHIALSTTLATNACLEHKGARAKLLLLGFREQLMDDLKDAFAAYGLTDMTRFVVMDAQAEGAFSHPYDPDWYALRRHLSEWFDDCDSVGIVQVYPRSNGGRFEYTALKILREKLDIPMTIAYDVSNETDILKTCAGTLINAMLIPLISEFMLAIRHVCDARGLNIPISIIRSNGTMMPEAAAQQYPVETILCGPAASVVGGSALAGEESGIVVDMGGTTTDICIVRENVPTPARGGISIGQWKTMVQGIDVETIGLGGDTAVFCRDHQLMLDTVRIIPLSVLAADYPDVVVPTLTSLSEREGHFSERDYEFYVRIRDISAKSGYTEQEQAICAALAEKPLTINTLARRMHCYPHFLPLARLESDGVILRSGLTPTDMMILKGDFTLYDSKAARLAAWHLAQNARIPLSKLPDAVYELVERRMYRTLGRILLTEQFPGTKEFREAGYLVPFLDAAYEQAKRRLERAAETKNEAADHPHPGAESAEEENTLQLTTCLPLIGVGAPVHIFLSQVAALLGTRAVVPEHAGVANALGAVVSRRIAHVDLTIHAVYEDCSLIGFAVPHGGKRQFFEKYDEAVSYGRQAILADVREKAILHGIQGEPKIELSVRDSRIGHTEKGMILDILLSATATE